MTKPFIYILIFKAICRQTRTWRRWKGNFKILRALDNQLLNVPQELRAAIINANRTLWAYYRAAPGVSAVIVSPLVPVIDLRIELSQLENTTRGFINGVEGAMRLLDAHVRRVDESDLLFRAAAMSNLLPQADRQELLNRTARSIAVFRAAANSAKAGMSWTTCTC